ncbi:hypothetical protein CcI6DRAFT_00520 [Frankia sp. CcI6]|uniref:hypothetical protein n=1 Tax=Frankia TaxID=1854 RepID=UPI0003D018B0|nr:MULTISPECIES: hypothetical protein [Frankia]ETA03996.1 hypothetical protein CcI6DRAFT_00520 [Frankia sp. CcI6]KFB06894.1 hypothetical protein ALLO2DRAFT_00182 [Frankia sp. Allo2]OAA30943.1 hypothetical protein AAY23_100431 [Frankia casuarinae]OHV54951.1 hypothetical protein CgIS1_02295 [Frankia sp. CgIS1]ORT51522.1 hypothetical protein KBI5_11570 [Frankia sp. KB5]
MSGLERLSSSTHIGMHVGSGWSVRCHTYPDRPPILSVRAGETHLSLSVANDAVTSDHVEFAYTLLAAVNDYLIECERIRFAVLGDPPEHLAA